MNIGLSFMSSSFLVAGAVCAIGPVLIHLLNRRRHRTIHWAAMEFLRKAVQKKRRMLNLRDWLLLAIRTLAVFLFGLAIARPYFSRHGQRLDANQPIHAILIVDNSLSMAYETLDGSLLEVAKSKAREVIEGLPRGSRMTIIPACGFRDVNVGALASREEGLDVLAKVALVDQSASVARAAELARLAAEAAAELPKQIVFFSDQQKANWQNVSARDAGSGLPAMQCIAVRPAEWENTWVADLRVQEDIADAETPTTVLVEVAHQGAAPRRDLQVTLVSGERVLGQQTVTVEPGGSREVSFECVLGGVGAVPAPGRIAFLPLSARIAADRLPADDERSLNVPIVAALSVVFIDQIADDDENVVRNRLGETRHLRKLLAPFSGRKDAPPQLVKVRHLTPTEVSRDVLADARLVVVAGLAQPGLIAPVLAGYVQQGGQLLVAAGVDFEPSAWNETAWLDGRGILPLRLKVEPIGVTPEEAPERLAPFQLSTASMVDVAIFQLAGVPRSDLESLYAEPFFFKAVEVDESPESIATVETADLLRIEHEQNKEPDEAAPTWLAWADNGFDSQDDHAVVSSERTSDATRNKYLPRVLARYDLPGKPPFLISRQIGRGQVVLCTTGVLSPWNTLPKTNAVLLFDRLMRSMIENTLPNYNFSPTDRLTLPLPRNEQHLAVSLQRPGTGIEEPLDVAYVSADRRGVTINGLLSRGVYRIAGKRLSAANSAASDTLAWEASVCVNGDAQESDLTPMSRSEFESRVSHARFRWIAAGDDIETAGSGRAGYNAWRWVVVVVLGLLAMEMVVIAVASSKESNVIERGLSKARRSGAVSSRLVEIS